MLRGIFSVSNGKFRAAVQAAEAQCALLFRPDGIALPQLDRIYRAIFCARFAADAGICNSKFLRLSPAFGGSIEGRRGQLQCALIPVEIARRVRPYFFNNLCNLRLCCGGDIPVLSLVGQIEYGRPGIHHPYGKATVQGYTFGSKLLCQHVICGAGSSAESNYMESIMVTDCFYFQVAEKICHHGRQTPKVGGVTKPSISFSVRLKWNCSFFRQSTMETTWSPVVSPIRDATYLLLPVAEK